MANKLARRYVHRVCRRMPVGGKQKRQFLANLRANVTQYLEENPGLDHAQLEAHFGTPDDIAADFISQMSYQQINEKFRFRNRVVAIVAAVAILIALLGVGAALCTIEDGKAVNRAYDIIGPVVTYYSEES